MKVKKRRETIYVLSGISNSSFPRCEIPLLNVWHPEILKFDDPNDRPSCKSKRPQITRFQNGWVHLELGTRLPNGYVCQARELVHVHDWKYNTSKWENISTFKAKRDIVEVRCGTDPENNADYRMLHSQIVERKDTTDYGNHPVGLTEIRGRKITTQYQRPNVYIIVFDSTSHSQYLRSMRKTYRYMTQQHQAVDFPFVNKVGLNSRPNAWALLFGKQITEMPENPYSKELVTDLDQEASCHIATDNENWWGRRLRDMGYHTMMSDDWAGAALNWPNCTGFARSGGGAKHYMKPFQIRLEENSYEILRHFKRQCHELYVDTTRYFDDFLSAYKNESQMAFMWNNGLTHGINNGLYHIDEYFRDLITKHQERLNNAFVIIMGDHGDRYGPIRQTKVGEIEDNNPFFMLSVPKKYRTPQLLSVLKANAQKLITHFDTYASLMHVVELLENDRLDELLNPATDLYKISHGSSYFQKKMIEPRDCGTLRIPFPYCLCRKKVDAPLDGNSKLSKMMGDHVLASFQKMIDDANVTSLCYEMSIVHKKTVAERLLLGDSREIYRLTVTVQPSYGEFMGYVEVLRNGGELRISMMTKRFERINRYGQQGACVEDYEDLRPLCYCKTWLNYLGISNLVE
ncbi:hypothetical protein QR680_006469 [Steinernema hermaphroditum]|uniref:Uncharacterized protein n=1 Tax=Steinernema hermaphroditum TaxID=289476 RepID=A0AA39HVJ8_9BILA|nr:hypothetical protein QR680_006469 [Steinernema hermaphroditum]